MIKQEDWSQELLVALVPEKAGPKEQSQQGEKQK